MKNESYVSYNHNYSHDIIEEIKISIPKELLISATENSDSQVSPEEAAFIQTFREHSD